MTRTTSLHPFTALSVAAAVVAIATTAGQWWLSCAVILASFFLALRAQCARKLSVLAAAIVLPALASQLMIHALASGQGSQVLAVIGWLRVTAEGLETALALGLRTAVLVVVGLLCALVIDRHQLVAAIDLSKAPPQLGYLVAATLFLLPQLAIKQRAIGEAQALRQAGSGRGVASWFQRTRLRAVPLVLGSLQDASSRAPHLAARGFPAREKPTRLRGVADSPAQRRVRLAALACTILGPPAILASAWVNA